MWTTVSELGFQILHVHVIHSAQFWLWIAFSYVHVFSMIELLTLKFSECWRRHNFNFFSFFKWLYFSLFVWLNLCSFNIICWNDLRIIWDSRLSCWTKISDFYSELLETNTCAISCPQMVSRSKAKISSSALDTNRNLQ